MRDSSALIARTCRCRLHSSRGFSQQRVLPTRIQDRGHGEYVALAAPVTLAPNTQYYLASQEEAGGDSWYNQDTTVTTTDAAVVEAPVYSRDARSWVAQGSGGSYSYGPVSLRYCAMVGQETALVTDFIAGDSWNNYTGWVGMQLQVGARPLEVSSLGRVYITGNKASHELRLVRVSDRVVLAAATWTPSGGVHNQIKYVALAAPVTLAPNTQYYLASREEAGRDRWYNHNTTVTTTDAAVVQARVYSQDGSAWVVYGQSGPYSYGPVSLGYCVSRGAGLSTALTIGAAREEMGELEGKLRGEGYVALKAALRNGHCVLSYTRNRLQSQDSYVLESSRDLDHWQPIVGQIHERVTAIDSATDLVDIEVPIDVTTTRCFYRLVPR